MLQGKDWDAIAKTQVLETFGKEGRKLGYQRMEEMLKCIDFMCNMHPDEVQPAVDTDKAACASIVTVEARRQIKNSTVWRSQSFSPQCLLLFMSTRPLIMSKWIQEHQVVLDV